MKTVDQRRPSDRFAFRLIRLTVSVSLQQTNWGTNERITALIAIKTSLLRRVQLAMHSNQEARNQRYHFHFTSLITFLTSYFKHWKHFYRKGHYWSKDLQTTQQQSWESNTTKTNRTNNKGSCRHCGYADSLVIKDGRSSASTHRGRTGRRSTSKSSRYNNTRDGQSNDWRPTRSHHPRIDRPQRREQQRNRRFARGDTTGPSRSGWFEPTIEWI